jgi:hypothetical protein
MKFSSLGGRSPFPRIVARFLCTFTAFVLLKLLFYAAGPLPGFVEVHPGLVMIPMAAILFGAGGAWAAALAAPFADIFLQSPGAPYSFAGYGLCAFTSLLVWRGLAPSEVAGDAPGAARTTVRALLAFLCGGFSLSLWPALGATFHGVYPFAFVALFQIFIYTAYLLLFFPVFLNLLVWLGGFLSLASGILVSGFLYNGWPWAHPPLGHRDGWIIWIAITPGLILQGSIIALGYARSRAAIQTPANPRFGSFYIPPIRKG